MNWLIAIGVGLLTYAVWDMWVKLNNYLKYKAGELDPKYPFYSAREIWVQYIKMQTMEKLFNEKDAIREAYWEEHKEELKKIKKELDVNKAIEVGKKFGVDMTFLAQR